MNKKLKKVYKYIRVFWSWDFLATLLFFGGFYLVWVFLTLLLGE